MRLAFAASLLCLPLVLTACGGGGPIPCACPASVRPTVIATTPASQATGVAITTTVSATFSTPMTSASLTTSTFTLTAAGGTAVSGQVSYSSSSQTATFTPSASLAYSTTYTATITTGATGFTGLGLAANDTWSFTTAATAPSPATIDFGTTYQTIRGFGGSTAWMPQMSTALASALYGTASGQIGLSILRVRIDPTSTTGGANWATELANAQEAIAAGSSVSVIATPWTPPAAYKTSSSSQPYTSGCTSSPTTLCGGYLDPAHYADYATYLNSFVTYFANGGVPLYGISMQNEPDASVTYESCGWTPTQMDTWIAGNASTLTTKLIMPESESFSTAYSDPSLADPNAVSHIGIIAGHLYGTQPSYYTNAENAGKDVWMTEYYLTPSGIQPAIADALLAAKNIHDSLTTGSYNAYLWWWVADWNSGSGVTNYGLVDSSNNLTFYGIAMAQFSRYIRPGYVRVSATANPQANVYLSAYSGNGHVAIVAINLGTSSVSQSFTLANATLSSLTPIQTTAGGSLATQSPVTVTQGAFTYTLPAQSITTFID